MADLDPAQIWSKARHLLAQSVPSEHLHFLDDLHPAFSAADNRLELTAPDQACLGITNFYSQDLERALKRVHPKIRLRIRCLDAVQPPAAQDEGRKVPSGTNFSTFVVGECNRSALNAAHNLIEPLQAGSCATALLPNPLILYGCCGVGKTHLLYAIANKVGSWRPGAVRYETSHGFFQAMRKGMKDERGIEKFRSLYRNLDVLLIDDLQFVAGKKRTQEEIGYLYNHLVEDGNGLLVLASNQRLVDLPLDERLRGRLQSGLSVKLELPDIETRRGILLQMSQVMGLEIPADCIEAIVSRINNARGLQGILVQIRNQLQLCAKARVTPELVEKSFEEQGVFCRQPSAEEVLSAVAGYYNIGLEEMRSARKAKQIVRPRQIAMFLLRELTGASYPEIGRLFGGRDHSTAMHACKKIQQAQKTNGQMRAELQALRERLATS